MTSQKMGPLKQDHPLVMSDARCSACGASFLAGDYVTLIPLGPGEDEEERRKAREGSAYTAVATTVHWACATGEGDDDGEGD